MIHSTSIIPSLVACGIAFCAAAAEEPPIKALLVIGGGSHDYATQRTILHDGLSARMPIRITVAFDPRNDKKLPNPIYDRADWAEGYDVVIHDEGTGEVRDPAIAERVLAPHRKGLPAVNLHCAMHSFRAKDYDGWFAFTGLTTHTHGAKLPITLTLVGRDHPILGGIEGWTTGNEEQYTNATVWKTVTPLVLGTQEGRTDVVAWTNDYHGTRVFCTTLGHFNTLVADPRYLDMVARGLLWTLGKLDDTHFHTAPAIPIPATTAAVAVPGQR